MNIRFKAKTVPDCVNYLKIKYEDSVYTLEEFSEKYKKTHFDIDILLQHCSIVYRNNEESFAEYCENRKNFAERLRFYDRCYREILPLDPGLQISNYEFYQAEKFLEKAEECLQTARYYLLKSQELFDYDCNIHWKTGYGPMFNIRCMNFKTAVVWYNNCFDYILQIPFLAFQLYKGLRGYKDDMTFDELLKMCTFSAFKKLHEENEDNDNLTELWNIVSKCRTAISDITDWANFSKHKGGLGFIGLKPESPFQIYIKKEGSIQKRTNEFECIKLDLDQAIEKTVSIHNALYDCLDELVDFIEFDKAIHTVVDGKIMIPDKHTYVKIIM